MQQNFHESVPLNHIKLLSIKWSKIVRKLERHTTEIPKWRKKYWAKITQIHLNENIDQILTHMFPSWQQEKQEVPGPPLPSSPLKGKIILEGFLGKKRCFQFSHCVISGDITEDREKTIFFLERKLVDLIWTESLHFQGRRRHSFNPVFRELRSNEPAVALKSLESRCMVFFFHLTYLKVCRFQLTRLLYKL